MKTRPTHAEFHEADVALGHALEELDANVPNYNEWLRALLAPAAVGVVMELGAGHGTLSSGLLQTAARVVAVEPSARAFAVLEARAAETARVVTVHGFARDAAHLGPFDGAVLSNVLEHIADDTGTLREMFELVRPGGAVAVLSPAFPLLMSNFDRAIGHVRRYRLADLCSTFESVGFEIETARYVNMPGFFAWLLLARLLNRRPTNSWLIRTYDRIVVPAARWIEGRVRPPFGQSVLVIARVPKG